MRSGNWRWACGIVVTVALLTGLPRPAFAQTDPRWGLLAEMVERDFHFGDLFGNSSLIAFRWEILGRQIARIDASPILYRKTLLTLDPGTGQIVQTYAGVDDPRYEFRVTVETDGSLRATNSNRPFLVRGDNGAYREGQNFVLVPALPDSPASRRAAKLIAAGKLRAADPSLRSVALAKTEAPPVDPMQAVPAPMDSPRILGESLASADVLKSNAGDDTTAPSSTWFCGAFDQTYGAFHRSMAFQTKEARQALLEGWSAHLTSAHAVIHPQSVFCTWATSAIQLDNVRQATTGKLTAGGAKLVEDEWVGTSATAKAPARTRR